MAVSGGKKKRLPPRVELVIETLAEILRQHADSLGLRQKGSVGRRLQAADDARGAASAHNRSEKSAAKDHSCQDRDLTAQTFRMPWNPF